MPILKGRKALMLQVRTKTKRQLEAMKVHYRKTAYPTMSMNLIVELLIEEKFQKLDLEIPDEEEAVEESE